MAVSEPLLPTVLPTAAAAGKQHTIRHGHGLLSVHKWMCRPQTILTENIRKHTSIVLSYKSSTARRVDTSTAGVCRSKVKAPLEITSAESGCGCRPFVPLKAEAGTDTESCVVRSGQSALAARQELGEVSVAQRTSQGMTRTHL